MAPPQGEHPVQGYRPVVNPETSTTVTWRTFGSSSVGIRSTWNADSWVWTMGLMALVRRMDCGQHSRIGGVDPWEDRRHALAYFAG